MPQRKIEDAFKTEELLQGIPSVSLSHQKWGNITLIENDGKMGRRKEY
jgi:hypothetical protein